MAWCLAILLLLALLAPGALQEAAWRPLTALLPQLATFALPFMATSLVSLLDTLSHSLSSPSPSSSSSVAALLLRMLHVVKNVLHLFLFRFSYEKKKILSRVQIFILSRRVHYTREKWIQIDRMHVFFLDLDLDVLSGS